MNKMQRSQQPVLAVDLSIWICEALRSSAMKDVHIADPALQLVYSRVLRLLSIGIKLVVVVEGKRRNRSRQHDLEDKTTGKPVTQDKFRKRRSGAPFWTACERCEKMLKLLGVIVVRAKVEGEALCALLNQRGIVDGVISNDGDCLLFGAKVLFTKFSVENLERSKILRYDANAIRVMVDDDDADRFDETRQTSKDGQEFVELSRKDLIAFAILTGSDLAGDGLSKVGCRKAIRFIRKCQIDNPLKLDVDSSPALEQLLSWEQTASAHGKLEGGEVDVLGPRCGCCGHLGTKRDHKKFGCKGCGTKPGEACFQLSPGGRFRKQMRAKALSMQSSFDPSSTLRAYYEPNENQIPLCLVGKKARKLEMNPPQLEKLLQLPFIIRGRSLQESREYVRKSLSVYLARRELIQHMSSNKETEQGDGPIKLPKNPNRPTPVRVSKLVVRNGKPSCEVQWIIKATTSDDKGNPLDEFEFSTIEDESIIQKCHPRLLQDFCEEHKKIQQQGIAEQEKRRNFLLSMERTKDEQVATNKSKTRRDYFEQMENNPKTLAKSNGMSDDVQALLIRIRKNKDVPKGSRKKERRDADEHIGRVISMDSDDCFIKSGPGHQRKNGGHYDLLDDSSTICTVKLPSTAPKISPRENYFSHGTLKAGHEYYLGIESAFQFRCMAGDDYQPRIDYKGTNSITDKHAASVESRKGTQEKAHVVTKQMLVAPRREPPPEIYDVEFLGLKRGSFGPSEDNESSLFEVSYARRENPTARVDGIFRPLDDEPNSLKTIEQRSVERELFGYHRNNEVSNHKGHEQSLMKEHFPRKRLFENEHIQERAQDLESSRRFGINECRVRWQQHEGKWNHDELQKKSCDFDSGNSLLCKRGKPRGRKRQIDYNGEFCLEYCEQKQRKRRMQTCHVDIRDQLEDGSTWLESNGPFHNSDGPIREKICIDMISSSSVMSNYCDYYQNHEDDPISFSRSLGLGDFREDEYREEWCRCEIGYRQCQSRIFEGTLDLCSEVDSTERIKIEKQVAAKVESLNRRARVQILCSKFIKE